MITDLNEYRLLRNGPDEYSAAYKKGTNVRKHGENVKKKICFVLNNMNVGGTEKAFLNMVQLLPKEKFDVTLLLLERSGGFLPMVPDHVRIEIIPDYDRMKPEIMDPPFKVVRREVHEGKILRAAGLALTHLIFKLTGDRTLYYRCVLSGIRKEEYYDYAVAYCGPFDLITVYVLYCMKARRKIQWIHFDVTKFYLNVVMYRKLFRKFHRICVISEEAREQLLAVIPEIAPKTKTVPNRISRTECRRMAALGEGFQDGYEGLRIVTLGRLSAEKGQDIIPDVARILADRGLEFRWYLIGDGKLREKIEALAAEFDVTDRLSFCGTQINPYPFLKQADIYVQTSVHEGYGIAIAEAKAFDLPVVSTDCTGAYEQLQGRENSRIVGRKADEIAEAILEISRGVNTGK